MLCIVAFFFILPAIFLIIFLEDLKLANLTHWLMIAGAVMISFDWGSLALFPLSINFIIRIMYSASYLFLPILFLHFSTVSPVKKFPKIENSFKYIYYLLLFLLIPIGYIKYQYLLYPTTNNIHSVALYDLLHNGILKNILLPFALLLIVNFVHSYYTVHDTVARKRLLWIFSDFIVGFAAYAFLYRLPMFLFNYPILNESQMLLFQIISPITLFIAIYKYQFFNIQLIIKRSVVYFSVIAVLTAGYISLVYFLNWWIYKVWDTEHIFSNSIAAILVALGFHPLKTFIQRLVDNYFFKIHFEVSAVSKNYSKQTTNLISEQSIINVFVETIEK